MAELRDKDLEAILRRARELLKASPQPAPPRLSTERDGSGLTGPSRESRESGRIIASLPEPSMSDEALAGLRRSAENIRLTPLEESRFVQFYLKSLRHSLCRLLEKDMFVTQFTIRASQVLSGEGASVRWAAAFITKLVGERGGGALAVVHLDTREARLIYVRGKGAGFYVTGEPILIGACGNVFDKYSRVRGYVFVYYDRDPAL